MKVCSLTYILINIIDHESSLLIQSIQETMIPKLVGEDVGLLKSLLNDLFPGVVVTHSPLTELRQHIANICQSKFLVCDEKWLDKVIQLYNIQNLQHGIILVGPSGKTSSWRVLLEALERLENIKGNAYVIDPKALSKEELYGYLDQTTREWTDGIFTHVLRKIVDNVRGESQQRHWIVFDGDVDPEWVENLNSVLDDNKLFTLPNGERLAIPSNVRIIFEVKDLKYATLATVSRCGMIWYSKDIVDLNMIVHNQLERMKNVPLDEEEEEAGIGSPVTAGSKQSNLLKVYMDNFYSNDLDPTYGCSGFNSSFRY
jgi:dynein heavy chain 1